NANVSAASRTSAARRRGSAAASARVGVMRQHDLELCIRQRPVDRPDGVFIFRRDLDALSFDRALGIGAQLAPEAFLVLLPKDDQMPQIPQRLHEYPPNAASRSRSTVPAREAAECSSASNRT